MAEIGSAWVSILPETKGFGTALNRQVSSDLRRAGTTGGDTYGRGFMGSAGSRFKSGAKSMFAGLAKGGAIAAAVGGAAIGKVLFDSIGEAREAAVVGARTDSVIKSMGGASKVTAKQVADLATALSLKTGVDDEAIQSGQNLLLTFGKIRDESGKGNDIFTRTSGLMVDMSRAMGTDAKGSAIQLGKALNDPVKGISALSRVGVSFSEDQKKVITRMTENGNILGAQKVILGEVEKQFGGAAESMATPADKAKVAWGNFQEELGTAMLPLVDKVLTGLADALPKILDVGRDLADTLGPAFSRISDTATALFDSFKGGGGAFGDLAPTFEKIRDVVVEVFDALRDAFGDEKTLTQFVDFVRDSFETVKDIFTSTVDILTVLWEKFGANIVDFLRTSFDNVLTIVQGVFDVLRGIFDVIAGVLTGDWDRVWEGIKDILKGALDIVLGLVKQTFNLLKFAFKNAKVVLAAVWGKLWPIIKDLARAGLDAVVGFVKSLPGRMVNVLQKLPGVVGDVFRLAFDGWKALVSAAADRIVEFVRNIPDRLKALGRFFLAAGQEIIGKFIKGFKGAGGLVSDIAGNVWDVLKGIINDAISSINDALEFEIEIPGAPNVHINIKDIPELARGARATSGTLAIIGEGREPETVFPDSVLAGFLERMGAASGRGVGINIENLVAHDYQDFMVQAQRRHRQAMLGGVPL